MPSSQYPKLDDPKAFAEIQRIFSILGNIILRPVYAEWNRNIIDGLDLFNLPRQGTIVFGLVNVKQAVDVPNGVMEVNVRGGTKQYGSFDISTPGYKSINGNLEDGTSNMLVRNTKTEVIQLRAIPSGITSGSGSILLIYTENI